MVIGDDGNLGIGVEVPLQELHIESGSPTIAIVEDDQAANEKVWHILSTESNFEIDTKTDAHAVGYTAMRITRSGSTPQVVSFPEVQMAIGTDTPLGQLTVDQASTGGAIPVLTLDQADVDHSFIDFVGGTIYGGMSGTNQYLKVKIDGAVRYLRLFS